MRKKLWVLLLVVFGITAVARAEAQNIPTIQRCFFSGQFDAGFFNNSTRDMVFKNIFGQSLATYVAYNAVPVSLIPKEMMTPGSELSDLLEMKFIRVARAFHSPVAAYEIMVLDKTNFNFVRENSNLSGLILVFNGFSDRFASLEYLMTQLATEVLVLDTANADRTFGVSCNIEYF